MIVGTREADFHGRCLLEMSLILHSSYILPYMKVCMKVYMKLYKGYGSMDKRNLNLRHHFKAQPRDV